MLFVLSTKTTTERFLLSCDSETEIKKESPFPGLFLNIVTMLIRAKLRVLVKKMKKSVQARRKL